MKVMAIIPGRIDKPSTRFRWFQYEEELQRLGVEIVYGARRDKARELVAKAMTADVIFNCKCLVDLGLARQLVKLGKRMIFDYDDAIYTRPGKPHGMITRWRVRSRLHFWLKNATVITVPNQVLAQYARRFSPQVAIVPMAVDISQWQPAPKSAAAEVRIGWIGSPANLAYLEPLGAMLESLLETNPQARLSIFCGRKPDWGFSFEYHPFDPQQEAAFVKTLDIGLLPLCYDDFALGKSPIKAIQYLACGVPVVGNIQGGTSEILTSDTSIAINTNEEWETALKRLIADGRLRKRMGETGRAFALNYHDRTKIIRKLYASLTGNMVDVWE